MLQNIAAGKYLDLPNSAYHGDRESISRSAIMEFSKSPRKYWAKYINPYWPEQEPTPAMQFGESFHAMILEPAKFEKDWVTLQKTPKVGLLKDLGREEYDRQKAEYESIRKHNLDLESAGKKILSQDDFETLCGMRTALNENEKAKYLTTDGVNESSYFWVDPDTGIMCKARPDVLFDSVCVDLKTTKDASPKAFQRVMCEHGYHIQAAMIIDAVKAVDGREIQTFVNIAIEKEYPYSIGIYIIDASAIEAGREKYKSTLVRMKEAKETGVYADYESQIIGLPAWAME